MVRGLEGTYKIVCGQTMKDLNADFRFVMYISGPRRR